MKSTAWPMRGGVVESAMIFGDAQSTIISDGEADLFLAFEPLEALRALNRCNADTTVITNTSPLPPFTAAIGKGVYPDLETITQLIKSKVGRLITLDANALAKEAGNELSVNIVLWVLIKTGVLPVTADKCARRHPGNHQGRVCGNQPEGVRSWGLWLPEKKKGVSPTGFFRLR
ncbi:MAG: 2-oxoacid:acceptor oxidoreductase family protein [Desulfobacterales bacterium]